MLCGKLALEALALGFTRVSKMSVVWLAQGFDHGAVYKVIRMLQHLIYILPNSHQYAQSSRL